VKLYIDLSSGKVVGKPLFVPALLMNPRVSADCDRFKQLTGRLLARQLKGDDLAGRVLWVLSRGPRCMAAVEYCRELLISDKDEFSLGLPLVVAKWGDGVMDLGALPEIFSAVDAEVALAIQDDKLHRGTALFVLHCFVQEAQKRAPNIELVPTHTEAAAKPQVGYGG
jgi:hypothetical protein